MMATQLVGRRVLFSLPETSIKENTCGEFWLHFFDGHTRCIEAVAFHRGSEGFGEFLALVSNDDGDTIVVPMQYLRVCALVEEGAR